MRVKKTSSNETILYINKYYEKNLTTSEITTYYYLGNRLVASKKGSTLRFHHQDHLTGTSLMTDSSGDSLGTILYRPFGETRSGSVPTDKLFTGQRLDDTELYYYGARYYDPAIGRFISPDIYVQSFANPQSFNRYSYVVNNPLKYTDPSGHFWDYLIDWASIAFDVQQMITDPSWGNAGWLAADVVLAVVPFVPAGAGPLAKGIAKGSQAINKGGKVVKGAEKAGKAGKVIKVADKLQEAAKAAGKSGKEFNVIGRGKDNYVETAKALGGKYLDVGDKWNIMSVEEKIAVNKSFLDEAIEKGEEFVLVSGKNFEDAPFYEFEVDYLLNHGYEFVDDNTRLIPKVGK